MHESNSNGEAQEIQKPHCGALAMVLWEQIRETKRISLTQTKRANDLARAKCKGRSKKAYPLELNSLGVHHNDTFPE